MATPFSTISIIYNPNSTGSSKVYAEALMTKLHTGLTGKLAKIIPTQNQGHAETLAYELTKGSKWPLIVSSSGDGGYNEIVNGIMRAKLEGYDAVCSLLPSGNANDHFAALHQQPLVPAIETGKPQSIDLLKVTSTAINGEVWSRYAHSYIGLGLTPQVGRELTKAQLNWFTEKWIVVKAFFKLRPVQIIVRGTVRDYSSLVFSNVDRMSRVLSLSKQASVQDGLYEVVAFRTRSKLALFKTLLKASTVGLDSQSRQRPYTFITTRKTLIQLDGEVFTLGKKSTVTVSLEPRVLKCII